MHDFQADVDVVSQIEAVPTILEVVCRTTGMGFAALARVTDSRWIACSVLDEIGFGLQPGGELDLETTLCNEIRLSREPVVIDNVADDGTYCGHPTPALYGFQSYISVPVILSSGSFFGTLCAIDPRRARLNTPGVLNMFKLFAELIAQHLDGKRRAEAVGLLSRVMMANRQSSEPGVMMRNTGRPRVEILPLVKIRGMHRLPRLGIDTSLPDAPATTARPFPGLQNDTLVP